MKPRMPSPQWTIIQGPIQRPNAAGNSMIVASKISRLCAAESLRHNSPGMAKLGNSTMSVSGTIMKASISLCPASKWARRLTRAVATPRTTMTGTSATAIRPSLR